MNNTFHQSLKPLAVEEFLDYYFYRRIAHLMVPILGRLKVSPNHISFMSMTSGVLAAYLVYTHHFVVAGFLAMLAIFFDCCDGQLARLSGTANPLGRALDGVFDTIWITALWFAILYSNFLQMNGHPHIFWIMLPASLSVFLHCWRYDAIKIKYLELAQPDLAEKILDCDESLQLMKAEFKKGHFFTAFIAACMAFQLYFFVQGTEKKKTLRLSPEEREIYHKKLTPIMERWSWLGESHHNTPIILGLLLATFTPHLLFFAFILILIPMNLWYIYNEWTWSIALKELQLHSSQNR